MSLCQPDKVADSHNLMVVLAHLQGAAATFRVGRHHHRGPLHEGRGLTHALTHDAPTDLTVAAALVRKASSKRRRSRLWPKPVNLRTWALVSDSIVMVQALAELRCGVVAYTRAKQCEIWAQFRPNPLSGREIKMLHNKLIRPAHLVLADKGTQRAGALPLGYTASVDGTV